MNQSHTWPMAKEKDESVSHKANGQDKKMNQSHKEKDESVSHKANGQDKKDESVSQGKR